MINMRTSPRVRVLQYLGLLGYLLFLLTPVAWLLSIAFKSPGEIMSSDVNWIPLQPTLVNFVTGFTEVPFARSLFNSVLISSVSALVTIILSVPAAYVMARHRGLISNVAVGWVIVSQLFPFILVLIPLFLLMIQLGLYNTHIGLIAVYVVWSIPFALWMLRSYASAIPIELEHAAAIDGAGQFRILKDIIGPLLVPGSIAAGMFAFVSSWNEFFFALVMLRDDKLFTLSLMIVRFVGADGGVRLGPLAAVAVLSTIPSLVFFAFMQRHLVSGLMGGAVKG
jgi:multiple sugar transport system permease protein